MSRRLLTVWGRAVTFVLVAGLAAGALGWVTVAALRVEAAQQEAAARADATNKERLALWQLDSRLLPTLGVENNRPYADYFALHIPYPVVLPEAGGAAAEPVRLPSPLLTNGLPDWMLLHFQVDLETGWSSPQVIAPDVEATILARTEGRLPLVNATPERRQLLDRLKTSFAKEDVVILLCEREKSDLSDSPLAVPFNPADPGLSPVPMGVPPASRPADSAAPADVPAIRLGEAMAKKAKVEDRDERFKDTTVRDTRQAPARPAAPPTPPAAVEPKAVPPAVAFGGAAAVVPAPPKGQARPEPSAPGPQAATPAPNSRGGKPAADPNTVTNDYAGRQMALNQALREARGGNSIQQTYAPPGGMPSPPAGPATGAAGLPGQPGGTGGFGGATTTPAPPAGAGPPPSAQSRTPGKPPEARGRSFERAPAPGLAADAKRVTVVPEKADGEDKQVQMGRKKADAAKESGHENRGVEGKQEAEKLAENTDRLRRFDRQAGRVVVLPIHPPAVHLGPMRPQWLTAPDGTEYLILVRAARLASKVVFQGVVLDWEQLREVLRTEVEPLFPEASLEPVKAAAAVSERAMTALPAQLNPGPTPVPPPAGWTGLRLGLVIAWIAAVVALAAVGVGGWSLIDLSERRIRFVSAVTHELRTPLTSLRLYLDLLTSGLVRDEEQQREYLTTLHGESERLNRLIENVLDFARLEKRSAKAHRQPMKLADLLDQVRQTWADRCAADGKDLVVMSTLPPAQEVSTDPVMAAQILGNLIDNARKYTREAADRRIWVWARPGGRRRIVLEVEDRGLGVPQTERYRIFRPFRRGQSADTTAGGAGLGLALAKQWAEMLGGSLTCRAAEGGCGACFRLELPVS